MYELRRIKPEPTLSPTHKIFKLPHQISMVWEELAVSWWRCKLYTVEKWIIAQLNAMAGTRFIPPITRVTQCLNQLSYLPPPKKAERLIDLQTNRQTDSKTTYLLSSSGRLSSRYSRRVKPTSRSRSSECEGHKENINQYFVNRKKEYIPQHT